jgi:hypothetical protein
LVFLDAQNTRVCQRIVSVPFPAHFAIEKIPPRAQEARDEVFQPIDVKVELFGTVPDNRSAVIIGGPMTVMTWLFCRWLVIYYRGVIISSMRATNKVCGLWTEG